MGRQGTGMFMSHHPLPLSTIVHLGSSCGSNDQGASGEPTHRQSFHYSSTNSTHGGTRKDKADLMRKGCMGSSDVAEARHWVSLPSAPAFEEASPSDVREPVG
jgi:hypothetical protein